MAFCSYRGNQGVRLIPMIICSSVQYNIRMNLGPVIVEEEVKCFIEIVIMPIVMNYFPFSLSPDVVRLVISLNLLQETKT